MRKLLNISFLLLYAYSKNMERTSCDTIPTALFGQEGDIRQWFDINEQK